MDETFHGFKTKHFGTLYLFLNVLLLDTSCCLMKKITWVIKIEFMTEQLLSNIDSKDVRCFVLLARFRLFRKFKASVIRENLF